MGGCFSVSLPCDQMVNQVCQWLCLKGSYIHNLPENLVSLEKNIEKLKAKRNDVKRRIVQQDFNGQPCTLYEVEEWLNNVADIENQVSDLLSTKNVELQRLCVCGFCSNDLKQSYRYGKSVSMMLNDIESLDSQGKFEVVTERIHVAEVVPLPIPSKIVGQKTLFERVWNHLMKDEVGIVGLYGMGGVGKTTLLKQINNKFSEISGEFKIVIWVVVPNGATVSKIQKDIATKLRSEKELDPENESQRATQLYNILYTKKFVLLLDGIWEEVNLEKVGVPYPSKENGCKVAFTTRSKEVCGSMVVDYQEEVCRLDPGDAWDLFEKIVGVKTLDSDTDIRDLARKVCNKCGGLPLALTVIGKTMACKRTVRGWLHVINMLTSSTTEYPVVDNEIFPILKCSFDNLKKEHVQSCFLYCSLFPEDYEIDKEMLIEYWICEGFIDEKQGRENALNQGYDILDTLDNASLLLDETRDKLSVRMHDVVREMALWITSDFRNCNDRWIVQPNVELQKLPEVQNWRVVEKISLMDNEIKEIVGSHECPQLTTLFLQRNMFCSSISGEFISNILVELSGELSSSISGEFFRSMSRLLVLDLSENTFLDELPEEISELVSLRYLNLSGTNIKRLPLGLQALKMLIYLNLQCTSRLESVNGISNLSNLRTIRLVRSKIILDMSLLKELELLEHLEFISINVSPSIIREQRFYDSRVRRCIQEVSIEYREGTLRTLFLPVMVELRVVYIGLLSCRISEIKVDLTLWNKSFSTPLLSNLSDVTLLYCNGLTDLTWLLFASKLKRLEVHFARQLETIISKEKAASFLEKEEDTCIITPFQKLERLELLYLPNLKSIHWTSLPFPWLKEVYIRTCENLRKLPLDSQSVPKDKEFVIFYNSEEWKEKIEWEDEATKLRFLPSLRNLK